MSIVCIKPKHELAEMVFVVDKAIDNVKGQLDEQQARDFEAMLELKSLLQGMVEYGDQSEIRITVE